MTQYVRPGTPVVTPQSDVVQIIAPAPGDYVQEIIYVPGSGTASGGGTAQVISYVHNQGVTSATWTINHNLGFYPNITVQDSTGTIVEGELNYTNRNTVIATFSSAFSGKAYLS